MTACDPRCVVCFPGPRWLKCVEWQRLADGAVEWQPSGEDCRCDSTSPCWHLARLRLSTSRGGIHRDPRLFEFGAEVRVLDASDADQVDLAAEDRLRLAVEA